MKVVVYPADLGGCGYYRLTWPAMHLKKLGHDVHVVHPHVANKLSAVTDLDGNPREIILPKVARDADVLVFQRVTSGKLIHAFRILREEMGKTIVVDVDDDMTAVDPRNPAWQQLNPGPLKKTEYNWRNGQLACEAASLVTVSSDALLARYAAPQRPCDPVRGVILHNYVPEVMLDIVHEEEPGVIGWGGSVATHPADPTVCGNSMNRVERAGYRFKLIGPPEGTREAFCLTQEPLTTGSVKIQDWPHALAKLAVGIAPLKDTRFNAAKSWLKPMEYAAVGVPSVMSPRAEYLKIHKLGIGLLAESPRDWAKQSLRLLQDDILRRDMSEQSREIVRQHLTLEKNSWQWWDAWTLAFERDKARA